jgi:cytochrome-b5 reductase
VKNAVKEAEDKGKEKLESVVGKKAFTGGDQGFISLKLVNIENVNHNTKKFRFELPEGDQVSGLQSASALLTKYKSPEMEKPAIRPYTPISDEGIQLILL